MSEAATFWWFILVHRESNRLYCAHWSSTRFFVWGECARGTTWRATAESLKKYTKDEIKYTWRRNALEREEASGGEFGWLAARTKFI